MDKMRWQVDEFLVKHRELDKQYYRGAYDDQDKYQCVITGVVSDIRIFLKNLKLEPRHVYIRFDRTLIDVQLNRLNQVAQSEVLEHVLTLYHVGSAFGQSKELKGWLEWLEKKRSEYPMLVFELRFQHPSTSEEFIFELSNKR